MYIKVEVELRKETRSKRILEDDIFPKESRLMKCRRLVL